MKLADFDFRIWDTENGKYVNENYAKNYHCVGIVKWFENFLGETQDFNKNEFFGFQFFNRDKGDCGGFNTTENAEIELWTGIRDKNGTKIYEGDIIRAISGALFIVGIDEDIKNWIVTNTLCQGINSQALMQLIDHTEVVGNIHENAELLPNLQGE